MLMGRLSQWRAGGRQPVLGSGGGAEVRVWREQGHVGLGWRAPYLPTQMCAIMRERYLAARRGLGCKGKAGGLVLVGRDVLGFPAAFLARGLGTKVHLVEEAGGYR